MNQEEIRTIEALEEFEVFEPIGTLESYVGEMPTKTGIHLTPYRLTSFADMKEATDLIERLQKDGRI